MAVGGPLGVEHDRLENDDKFMRHLIQVVRKLNRMLVAQRKEMDSAKRREIVLEIQRYLSDKAYYVYLPMWPRYIAHPPYVKGFRHHDGYDLGRRLTFTWIDR